MVQLVNGTCGTSDTCGEWYMCLLKLFGSLGSLSHDSLMVTTAGGVCKHFISVYEILLAKRFSYPFVLYKKTFAFIVLYFLLRDLDLRDLDLLCDLDLLRDLDLLCDLELLRDL